MSDYVYESGMSTKRRRQRRTAITLLLTLLFLFGAFWWAWSYIRDGGSEAASEASATTPAVTATTCAGEDDPKNVTINVYNSTTISGLAAGAAADLKAAGFTIGTVANDPEGIGSPWPLVVRFGPEGQTFAERFRDHYVPVGLASPRDRTGTDLDLILGQGFEELPPVPVLPPCESE